MRETTEYSKTYFSSFSKRHFSLFHNFWLTCLIIKLWKLRDYLMLSVAVFITDSILRYWTSSVLLWIFNRDLFGLWRDGLIWFLQLRNDELLLNHLDLFVQSLKQHVLQLIYMFKEHPNLSKSPSIEILHQSFHQNLRTALELSTWNCTNVCELFKYLISVLLTWRTFKKNSWLFSESSWNEYEVSISEGSQSESWESA